MCQQYQIILVNDDFSIRILLEEYLQDEGHQVLSFDNGDALLDAFSEQQPDLILLDTNMPGKNSFELCQLIRQHYDSVVPVVIMSSLTDLSAIESAYQCGATDFFSKPLSCSILMRRIHYIMRSKQTLPALHPSWQAQDALSNTIPDIILKLSKTGDLLDSHQVKSEKLIDFSKFRKLNEFPMAIKQALLSVLQTDPQDRPVVEKAVKCTVSQQNICFNFRCSYSDNNEYIVILRNMTQQHEVKQRLRYLALYDEMTGLPNRRYLEQYLFSSLKKARRYNDTVGVIFIDIDNFNKFNDLYGLQNGDLLLAEFSGRLQNTLREHDFSSINNELTYFSSDEFIVVIERTNEESMFRIAKRLQQGLATPFYIENKSLQLSASMGIAISTEDSGDYLQLIHQADAAKREAKRRKGEQICFYNAYQAGKVKRRYEIEQALTHALSNNEFSLLYQPQIQICDQLAYSAEALIRWHNVALGSVPTEEFIDVAESCGKIHAIGDWLFSRVCEQLVQWQKKQVPIQKVAINISAIQLCSNYFLAEKLAILLKKHRLPGSMIEIEITENVFLTDVQQAKKQLRAFKALGCSIAIDDFGTGYSSLSYLNSFEFDILKIDKSFICQIGENEKADSLIKAIITIARSLSLQTTVEGVETQQQAQFIAQNGGDYIQGYLYSRPLSADALAEYLTLYQPLPAFNL